MTVHAHRCTEVSSAVPVLMGRVGAGAAAGARSRRSSCKHTALRVSDGRMGLADKSITIIIAINDMNSSIMFMRQKRNETALHGAFICSDQSLSLQV